MSGIYLYKGDITSLHGYDAIVNAANETLLGGGGVDGAIHKAAGHKLLEECRTLNGCQTGEAKITKAYDIDAKYIIHTVGPKYFENPEEAPVLLYTAYTNCMELAERFNLKRIAFPAISTGIYGYPVKEAAEIAYKAVIDFIKKHPEKEYEVTFVLYTDEDFEAYAQACSDLIQ